MDELGSAGDDFATPEVSGQELVQSTIWDELNAWGTSLADWQRYIISYSVRDGTLTSERVEEAYRIFLRDRGLSNGDEELPHVPKSVTGRATAERTPLTLKAVKSLKNVNAIPELSQVKPDEIFSEGEQRALSLADFLTEVNLNPTSAAIVLDDPVTSLDHQRKIAIAKRLVEEAGVRQVIIFTHDLVFLTLLSDHAEAAGHAILGHWVESKDGVPGHVNIDETPANTKIYRKTTKAKDFLDRAKKASGREKVDLVRSGAGALRRTIEEVVVFHLFKDTVRRWNEQIRLGAVAKISWSDDVADEIVTLQDDTSRLLEGHSNSDEFAGGMPDVDGLEKLIARVDALIDKAKAERK